MRRGLWVFIAFRSVISVGTGGLGAVSGGVAELLRPGAVGFVLGFYWMLRRQRARTANV